jgi:hypothetical protein
MQDSPPFAGDDNPYRAPASEPLPPSRQPGPALALTEGQGIYRDGNQLVFEKGALLPDVCLKTNDPGVIRRTQTLYWVPSWVLIGILFGILPYVILSMFFMQSALVTLPFAPRRVLWQRNHLSISVLLIGGGFATMLFFPGRLLPLSMRGYEVGTGLVMVLIGCEWAAYLVPLVYTARISARHVWLQGIHPAYLDRWPPFPGEQAAPR